MQREDINSSVFQVQQPAGTPISGFGGYQLHQFLYQEQGQHTALNSWLCLSHTLSSIIFMSNAAPWLSWHIVLHASQLWCQVVEHQ